LTADVPADAGTNDEVFNGADPIEMVAGSGTDFPIRVITFTTFTA